METDHCWCRCRKGLKKILEVAWTAILNKINERWFGTRIADVCSYDSGTLIDKLDIFARTCYRIILGIKQSRDHVANESQCHLIGQVPRSKALRERQLKFADHCIRMQTDKSANRFFIYESKISSFHWLGASRTTNLNQIRLIFYLARKSSKPISARMIMMMIAEYMHEKKEFAFIRRFTEMWRV